MGAAFGARQVKLRAPTDDIAPMCQIVPQNLIQRQHFRKPVNETEQARAEIRLHLRMLIELVENHLRNLAAFQDNDDADVAIGFVADI